MTTDDDVEKSASYGCPLSQAEAAGHDTDYGRCLAWLMMTMSPMPGGRVGLEEVLHDRNTDMTIQQ